MSRKHAVWYLYGCFSYFISRTKSHWWRGRENTTGQRYRAANSMVCADEASEDFPPQDIGPAGVCKWDHGRMVKDYRSFPTQRYYIKDSTFHCRTSMVNSIRMNISIALMSFKSYGSPSSTFRFCLIDTDEPPPKLQPRNHTWADSPIALIERTYLLHKNGCGEVTSLAHTTILFKMFRFPLCTWASHRLVDLRS